MFSVRRTIARTALILGVAGAVAVPGTALAASPTGASAQIKAPSVELTKSMKRQGVETGDRLSKSERRAMQRDAKRVKQTKAPRKQGHGRVGGGGVVDSGCTDWFALDGYYQAYCVYVFGDGSVGVDWYLYGYGYYWTDWYV